MNNAPAKLAVLTPRWGAASETFVRRYLTAISPGQTVAMTRDVSRDDWCPGIPLLPIRTMASSPVDQLARVLGLWKLDRQSKALRNFLCEHRPRVVMGQWLNFTAKWLPALGGLDMKVFAHAHGYDVTHAALKKFGNRMLYRRLHAMAGIITMSQLTKQRLITSVGLDPAKIHVVPYGVEIPPATPQRAESKNITSLCVGRLVPKKGHLESLRAFEKAFRTNDRLRLELIGDGPLRGECERFCAEHRLTDVVIFHGSKPHPFVAERLAQADIFLLHSVTAPNGDEEGLPVAILEAMAHSLPILSTHHAGIPEAVDHGQSGFLVIEHDWAGMARHWLELAASAELRQRFGAAARARAVKDFSAGQEIDRLREILFNGN